MRPLRWRDVRPNTSTKLALVSRERPEDALWPVRLTQIIGGRRWSLSFVWHLTPTPVPTRLGLEKVLRRAEGTDDAEVSR